MVKNQKEYFTAKKNMLNDWFDAHFDVENSTIERSAISLAIQSLLIQEKNDKFFNCGEKHVVDYLEKRGYKIALKW